MSRLIARLLVVLAFGWAGSASAVLMDPVTVDGRDWLQPVDFINLSWNDINTVCDATSGLCNGSLGGNDLSGWTWASVTDINALFNHFIGSVAMGPGPSSYSQAAAGPGWLEQMSDDGFIPTYVQFPNDKIEGILRSTDGAGSALAARVGVGIAHLGPFALTLSYADSNVQIPLNGAGLNIGGWFVRDPTAATVPIPGTLALVAIGICALSISVRKRTLYV